MDDDPFATLVGIDIAAGRARTSNNDKLYRRLLAALARQLPTFAARFREALDQGDHAQAIRLAHDLGSNAGSLGAGGVELAARALEAGCRDAADPVTIELRLAVVEAEIATVLPGLLQLGP